MDIERLEELSECGRELYILNDENLIERIRSDNQLQNYLSDSVDAIDEAIARQSVTSEEVQMAIKRFEKRNNKLKEVQDNGDAGCVDIETWEKYQGFIEDNNLAITALQAYQPWIPVCERKRITQESEAEDEED